MQPSIFKQSPLMRLLTFALTAFAGLILCSLLAGIMTLINPSVTASSGGVRLLTVVQDVLIFIFPAVATAMLVSVRPARLLRADGGFPLMQALLAVAGLIVSMPAMNALVAWNESLQLPQSMAALEESLKITEDKAKEMVELMVGGNSPGDLIAGVLLIGILAGLSEELFFRGTMQRIFATLGASGQSGEPSPAAAHAAIWATAFLFSAIHMQFYGFLPRLLLGAYFGYCLWWSRSLWIPVTVHALNNTIVVVSSWLEKRGAIHVDLNTAGSDNPVAITISLLLLTGIVVLLYRMRRCK